jgi:hypothetical protein
MTGSRISGRTSQIGNDCMTRCMDGMSPEHRRKSGGRADARACLPVLDHYKPRAWHAATSLWRSDSKARIGL